MLDSPAVKELYRLQSSERYIRLFNEFVSSVALTVHYLNALRFSTVNATLLISRFFFKFQKSNSNDVVEYRNRLHLKLHFELLVQNS